MSCALSPDTSQKKKMGLKQMPAGFARLFCWVIYDLVAYTHEHPSKN